MLPLVMLLVSALPGCIEPQDGEPADAAVGPSSARVGFADVVWPDEPPASGETFFVTATLLNPHAMLNAGCQINSVAARSAGAGSSTTLIPQGDGRYACLVTAAHGGDVVRVYLWAKDHQGVVRTPFIDVPYADAESDGAPPSAVRAFRVEDRPEGGHRVIVELAEALMDNAALETRASVSVHVHHPDLTVGLAAGAPLEATAPGRFEADVLTGSAVGQPLVEGDYVILAYAYTANRLGGLAYTAWVEHGVRGCAERACIVESPASP